MYKNSPASIRKFLSLKVIISYLLFICFGIFVGYFSAQYTSLDTQSSEMRAGVGFFTNPLLECDVAQNALSSKNIDFKPDLTEAVAKIKSQNNLSDISVYFRDLNNGPVINLNSDLSFSPASLLKVPILIAYLKWSEDMPGVLQERVEYKKAVETNYTQQFAPEMPLIEGQVYTVRELLESMIKYSDNQAFLLLYQRLPESYQSELYKFLGVDADVMTDEKKTISVKQYSIFFRVLYNSSFLSRAYSEYALQLLSYSTFNSGIRASVPNNIVVSHKFGERKSLEGVQQFHDCGVVYYPGHPYMICIMTRGNDTAGLIDAINKTSNFVYKEIDGQYKDK